MVIKKIALTIIFSLQISLIFARLTVEAHTKYQKTDKSYSTYYAREIDLYTGSELNTATKTNNYDTTADYALIWFSQDQVAIIKLDKLISPGNILRDPITKTIFDIHCNLYGYIMEGVDKKNVKWKLCFYPSFLPNLCPE
jgi:hypothetical protein